MRADGHGLWQRKTETKSNEITAIPELLQVLDLRGATVTIDAMGCQTKIAETVFEGGGHYVLSVKENQPTLHDDVAATFAEATDNRQRSVDEQGRPQVEVFEQVDKGHGRVETRTLSLCRDLSWMTTADAWCGLDFVAQVVRQRTVLTTGQTSTETAYFIGSDPQARAVSANSERCSGACRIPPVRSSKISRLRPSTSTMSPRRGAPGPSRWQPGPARAASRCPPVISTVRSRCSPCSVTSTSSPKAQVSCSPDTTKTTAPHWWQTARPRRSAPQAWQVVSSTLPGMAPTRALRGGAPAPAAPGPRPPAWPRAPGGR